MTRTACRLESPPLLEYWLGELDEAAEAGLEEHLFACASCTRRLRGIAALGQAIRGEFLRGALNIVLPEAFLERVRAAGVRLREYTLEPGGSVDCTITPDDDLVLSRLRAPLDGVQRLDVLIDTSAVGRLRAEDVPFDPEAEGIAAVTSSVFLRTLGNEQQRMRLVAVDGQEERVIADYTFNHYPS